MEETLKYVKETLESVGQSEVPVTVIENYCDDDPAICIDGFLYLYYGEYTESYKNIAGEEVKRGVKGYILEEEYTEHNYPHEPDWTDVMTVIASTHIVSVLDKLAHRIVDCRLDNFLAYLEHQIDMKECEEYSVYN